MDDNVQFILSMPCRFVIYHFKCSDSSTLGGFWLALNYFNVINWKKRNIFWKLFQQHCSCVVIIIAVLWTVGILTKLQLSL